MPFDEGPCMIGLRRGETLQLAINKAGDAIAAMYVHTQTDSMKQRDMSHKWAAPSSQHPRECAAHEMTPGFCLFFTFNSFFHMKGDLCFRSSCWEMIAFWPPSVHPWQCPLSRHPWDIVFEGTEQADSKRNRSATVFFPKHVRPNCGAL